MILLSLIFSIALGSGSSQAKTSSPQGPIINSFTAQMTKVELCPAGRFKESSSICVGPDDVKLTLLVNATSSNNRELRYEYSASSGKIIGSGPRVTWYFKHAPLGAQTAKIAVRDSDGRRALASTSVVFEMCSTCDPPRVYPTIQLLCPTLIIEGSPSLISAKLTGPGERHNVKFIWTVSDGKIVKGQGRGTIKLDTRKVSREVTATVSVSGLDPSAPREASCVIAIGRE